MNNSPSQPCIGIFWILAANKNVCAFPEPWLMTAHGRHFQDSEDAHIRRWPSVTAQYKELAFYEYEEIPRGRILYDYTAKKFLAYVCADFVNDAVIRTALREAFGLQKQKIRWATDEHYNFDHEIDPADVDDY